MAVQYQILKKYIYLEKNTGQKKEIMHKKLSLVAKKKKDEIQHHQ